MAGTQPPNCSNQTTIEAATTTTVELASYVLVLGIDDTSTVAILL